MKKISNPSGAQKETISYLQEFREAPSHLKKGSWLDELRKRVEKARAEKHKEGS